MWQTISYVSTTNSVMTSSEIHELLVFTKETNNRNKITGILMYSDGNFFQVLEGKTEIITPLFQKIKLDTRHHNIIKIFDRKITNTAFSEYESSFVTINAKTNKNIELEAFLLEEKNHNPDNFKNISYIAHKFIKHS